MKRLATRRAKWIVAFLLVAVAVGLLRQQNNSTVAPAGAMPQTAGTPRATAQTSFQQSSNAAPIFRGFSQWFERYANAASDKSLLEAEGVELARARRAALKQLIPVDPAHALELAVPFSVRRQLPAPLEALLEEPISGRGDLDVLAALPESGAEGTVTPTFRVATLDGQRYQAFVYGRRLGEPSRRNIPMHGIAVDEVAAVDEQPARVMEIAEVPNFEQLASEEFCGVSAQPATANNQPTPLEVDKKIYFVCGVGHVDDFNAQLIAAESSPPERPYTEGIKRIILIRVDFSDLPGEPFPDSTGLTLLTNMNNYWSDASYNKTTVLPPGLGSDVTPTFRMPNTAAYYGMNNFYDQLRADARLAADAAGYLRANYEFDVICFGRVPGWSFAGLGYVGQPGSWLRNSFGTGVTAHELGHNLGLNHGNFWDTGGQSSIGAGRSVEYGDSYDTMGSGGSSNPYNARYRAYLDWITTGEVVTATTNGIYRLNAYDVTNSVGPKAIRIARGGSSPTNNYWLEFRQRTNATVWQRNGAGLRWAGTGTDNRHSQLIDTTPGSGAGSSSKEDSPIWIGRTFSDRVFGIHITVVGKTGTTPDALNVMINRGTFPTNMPPVVSINATTTNPAPALSVTLTATASDPNGDSLAYSWDFGDGTFSTVSSATTSHSWAGAGEYLVRCIVSDMRGGVASDWLIVRVGAATTYRISGRVTTETGAPIDGVRVYVTTTRMAYTGSDGTYTIVNLPAGTYSVRASLEGWAFTNPTFNNPVTVGPNASNIDFIGGPPGGIITEILVAQGVEWKYLDNGSDQGTAWYGTNFNDSTWDSGPGQLGYGDNDEATVVSYGTNSANKYITTYFRHSFVVTNPAELASVTLGLLRDDGAVVYLNEREIFRSNMPPPPINYLTRASDTVDGSEESTYYEQNVDSTLLRVGTNLLAVEIHQSSSTSSDISFDLNLTAINLSSLPRGVYVVSPVNNATVLGPTNVLIRANASAGSGSSITRVEFFEGERMLGSSTTPPYSMIWSNVPIGAYTLSAIATDSAGLMLTSAPVTVNVSAILMARGSIWHFLDNGSDQGTAWRQTNFVQAGWASGPAPLGYNDPHIRTGVSYGPSYTAKYITTYFRRWFRVTNAATVTNAVFRLLRDDGAIVFLNGTEIFRSNMTNAPVTYTNRALVAVDGANETTYFDFPIPTTTFREGTNLLAVEIHQSSSTSSDIGFDLELVTSRIPVVVPPRLVIERSDSEIRIIWPSSYASWRLYSSDDVSTGWTLSTHSVTTSNDQNVVTFAPTNTSQFFRLQR